ncbi:MAG: lytic transglycosylase domain-containing protein [Acidobacteria bacterium]|nr:lytic transglycosylase domain-containing protein [Acidobacteriota bacterium]
MSLAAYGAGLLALGLLLSGSVASARADNNAYVDQDGRRIYVNVEDEELRAVVQKEGTAGGLRLMEQRRRSLAGIEEHIEAEASRHSIDPRLVRVLIEVESAWNHRARSRKGALGLMQLMPDTGARYGVRDFFNPKENVSGGVRYLRFLLDRFENNTELALAAYNAGENAVEAANGVPRYRETRQFLERLQGLYGRVGAGWVPGTRNIYRVVEQGQVIFTND